MLKTRTQRVVTAGLLVAAGLIVPYFTSHMFAIQGTILLPMHLPILLCGLLCGPTFGLLCGLVVPVLSSVLTGMPPAYPMLPIMLVQLAAMGAVSGLLYDRLKLSLYPSIVLSMASGWAVYGLMFAALALANPGLRALSVTAALVQGVPGLAIQLTLVPAIVAALKKQQQGQGARQDGLERAVQLIRSGAATCVVVRSGEIIHTAEGRGVSPLLKLYDNEPQKLSGSLVVDKIIGKAAAMILVLGGAREVYGEVMSRSAEEYLSRAGLSVRYGRCVDLISNREGSGICPIERSVLEIEDAQQGLAQIRETVKALMNRAI